jgi:DNA-binding NtrC family response regulator
MLELPLREARDRFDVIYFTHHLEKEQGNVTLVAQKVGLERTHLYRKLKQLDIRFPKKNGEGE